MDIPTGQTRTRRTINVITGALGRIPMMFEGGRQRSNTMDVEEDLRLIENQRINQEFERRLEEALQRMRDR